MARSLFGAAGMGVLGQRIVYGIGAISVLILVFRLDIQVAEWSAALDGPLGDLFRRGSILPLFILIVVICGAVELCRVLRDGGARPYALFAYLMIATLLITPWLSAAGWLGSSPEQVEGLYWQHVALMAATIGTGIMCVIRRTPEGALRDAGATLLMIIYLGFLGSFAVQLRCGIDVPSQEGAWLLLDVILVAKSSDIGAFFVGSAFGRHKLIPSISPAKSVEGMFGGLAASILVAVLLASAHIPRSFGLEHGTESMSPLWRAALFGLAVSIASQCGDLIESCFKRDAGVKDSGEVIPCFGGILDLIDSPVLALPVAWFLLTGVWDVV